MCVHVFVCGCGHRKSTTGVDWFILDTEPGYAVKIHRVVDYWAKHIVEQVKNLPSSGTSGRSVPVSARGLVGGRVGERGGVSLCQWIDDRQGQ